MNDEPEEESGIDFRLIMEDGIAELGDLNIDEDDQEEYFNWKIWRYSLCLSTNIFWILNKKALEWKVCSKLVSL